MAAVASLDKQFNGILVQEDVVVILLDNDPYGVLAEFGHSFRRTPDLIPLRGVFARVIKLPANVFKRLVAVVGKKLQDLQKVELGYDLPGIFVVPPPDFFLIRNVRGNPHLSRLAELTAVVLEGCQDRRKEGRNEVYQERKEAMQ